MSIPEVAQTAVRTASGGSINAGIWTLVGLVVSTIGVVSMSVIKQWGPWKKGEVDADTQLRSEMWKDIAALKIAKSEQGARLTLAEAEIAGQKVEIGQQRFILNLVISELENVSPGNAIARQARLLMDQVQPSVFVRAAPFAQDLTSQITRPGVGE
jgi:hypothetical protein